MVKRTITITTILLILTMVVSLIIALNRSSFAAENDGPAEDGSIYVNNNDYIFNAEHPETAVTIPNISYDIGTNTLTLNNFSGESISAYNMGKDFKIKIIGENQLFADPENYDLTEIITALSVRSMGNEVGLKIYGVSNSEDERDSLRLYYSNGLLVEGDLTIENVDIDSTFVETFGDLTINNGDLYTGFIDCNKFVENGENSSVIVSDAFEVKKNDGSVGYYNIYSRANSIKIITGYLNMGCWEDIYYVKSEVYGPGNYNGVYDEPYEFSPANTPIEIENIIVKQEGDWNQTDHERTMYKVLTKEGVKNYYRGFAVDIIDIIRPVAGEIPSVDTLKTVFPGLDEVYNDRCYWFDKDEPGKKVTRFEAGKVYGLYVEMYATMSMRFGESTHNDDLDYILFEEEYYDEMGELDAPSEYWAIKYYDCIGENPPQDEPEPDPIPDTNETKTEEPDLDKDVKDSNLDINNDENKSASNPKTGDVFHRYLINCALGISALMIVVRIRRKYSRKVSKIQY